LRPASAIRAENLVLRKQLARDIERGIKPQRADHATRVSLALLTRMFDWRAAVVTVRPILLNNSTFERRGIAASVKRKEDR
jgi:hypothetical protein